ncbi:MAG TPA: gamma-glutamylcyclotransferase [Aquifex sp.]|nr:gamma-glutamylcyclotransferase [Aquifex sp.]
MEVISAEEALEITPYVAVYGTLKYGFPNHEILAKGSAVGVGYTVTPFKLFDVGYPYAVPSKYGLPLQVEVYLVPQREVLEELDALEGYPYHYNREPFKVFLRKGIILDAWLYFTEHPEGKEITGGYLDKETGMEYTAWRGSYLLMLEDLLKVFGKKPLPDEGEYIDTLKRLTEFLLSYRGSHKAVEHFYGELIEKILNSLEWGDIPHPAILGFLLAVYHLERVGELPTNPRLEEFLKLLFPFLRED